MGEQAELIVPSPYVQMKRKVFLEGDELEAHLEAERQAAELEAKHQAVLERSRRMFHADGDEDSDSDSDDDEAEGGGTKEEPTEMDGLGVVPRRRTGGFTGGAGAWDEFLDEATLVGRAGGQSFDIYVKGEYGVKGSAEGLSRFRMFPVVERKRRVDAYGEAIDVEGWLKRGVEDDPFKAMGAPAQAAVLGKRAREEEEKEEVRLVVCGSAWRVDELTRASAAGQGRATTQVRRRGGASGASVLALCRRYGGRQRWPRAQDDLAPDQPSQAGAALDSRVCVTWD